MRLEKGMKAGGHGVFQLPGMSESTGLQHCETRLCKELKTSLNLFTMGTLRQPVNQLKLLRCPAPQGSVQDHPDTGVSSDCRGVRGGSKGTNTL